MPRKHMSEIVLPNIAEFKEEYGNIRRSFNAVAAVDALMGHLYYWCRDNDPKEVDGIMDDSHYRKEIGEDCPDLLLLRDIAKAQKHVRLERSKAIGMSASQIAKGDIGWGQGGWGEGVSGGLDQIIFEAEDGSVRAVESIVKSALRYLELEMERLQIPKS